MTAETRQETYDRGVLDGRVATRLDGHDAQITAGLAAHIQMVDIATTLTSTVQTLTEARVTDAATRVATAEAVKEAKLAQEAQAQTGWSPVAKLSVAAGVVAILWAILQSLPLPM